jgi:hypothetical protein
MIRHVVAFKLAADDADDRARDAITLRDELGSLVGSVPQLRHLEVGIELGLVPGHWDACLVTDFDSVADLETYQAHPEHVRVLGVINPLVSARAVVDYEV